MLEKVKEGISKFATPEEVSTSGAEAYIRRDKEAMFMLGFINLLLWLPFVMVTGLLIAAIFVFGLPHTWL